MPPTFPPAQVGVGFNRDYWERFERFVRDCAKRADSVVVVTGPLWIPRPDGDGKWVMQHPCIGGSWAIDKIETFRRPLMYTLSYAPTGEPPALVSVPTHFYKVIPALV